MTPPLTSNIVEIHIKITNLLDILEEGRAFVIERAFDAELRLQPFALVVASCYGVDFGACGFAQLTCNRTNRAGGARNDQLLASFEFTDLFESLLSTKRPKVLKSDMRIRNVSYKICRQAWRSKKRHCQHEHMNYMEYH